MSDEFDRLVTRESCDDAAQTVQRLLASLDRRNLRLFSLIDHAAVAATVGLELPPTQVIAFGSPQVGTPLMQVAPTLAIDLPLRILVREDESGRARLYHFPAELLGQRHRLDERSTPALRKMSQSLCTIVADAAGLEAV